MPLGDAEDRYAIPYELIGGEWVLPQSYTDPDRFDNLTPADMQARWLKADGTLDTSNPRMWQQLWYNTHNGDVPDGATARAEMLARPDLLKYSLFNFTTGGRTLQSVVRGTELEPFAPEIIAGMNEIRRRQAEIDAEGGDWLSNAINSTFETLTEDIAEPLLEAAIPAVVVGGLTMGYGGLAAETFGGAFSGAESLGTVDPVTAYDASQGIELFEFSDSAAQAGGTMFTDYTPDFPTVESSESVFAEAPSDYATDFPAVESSEYYPDFPTVDAPAPESVFAEAEYYPDFPTADYPAPETSAFPSLPQIPSSVLSKIYQTGEGMLWKYVQQEIAGGKTALVPQSVRASQISPAAASRAAVRAPVPITTPLQRALAETEAFMENNWLLLAIAGAGIFLLGSRQSSRHERG